VKQWLKGIGPFIIAFIFGVKVCKRNVKDCYGAQFQCVIEEHNSPNFQLLIGIDRLTAVETACSIKEISFK